MAGSIPAPGTGYTLFGNNAGENLRQGGRQNVKKKVTLPVWVLGLAMVVALILIGAAGAGGKKANTASASTPAATVTVTATTTATAKGANVPAAAPAKVTVTVTQAPTAPPTPTGYTDGTYLVGSDIKPGTYKSAGPASGGTGECYWERSDKNNSPIDNGLSKGQSIITIQSGDYSVTFNGCQPFVKS